MSRYFNAPAKYVKGEIEKAILLDKVERCFRDKGMPVENIVCPEKFKYNRDYPDFWFTVKEDFSEYGYTGSHYEYNYKEKLFDLGVVKKVDKMP